MTIDDFPIIKLLPAWTDDDNDFHSDILYFRALLNDIAELVYLTRFANPFPIELADDLAAATDELRKVSW